MNSQTKFVPFNRSIWYITNLQLTKWTSSGIITIFHVLFFIKAAIWPISFFITMLHFRSDWASTIFLGKSELDNEDIKHLNLLHNFEYNIYLSIKYPVHCPGSFLNEVYLPHLITILTLIFTLSTWIIQISSYDWRIRIGLLLVFYTCAVLPHYLLILSSTCFANFRPSFIFVLSSGWLYF